MTSENISLGSGRRGAIDFTANEPKRKRDASPNASHSEGDASPHDSRQSKKHRRGKRRRIPNQQRGPGEENALEAPPRHPRLNAARRLSNRTAAELTPGMGALRDALSPALPRERAEGMGRWAGEVKEMESEVKAEKMQEDAMPATREEIAEWESEYEPARSVRSRRSRARAARALRKQRQASLQGRVRDEETGDVEVTGRMEDAGGHEFDIDIYGDEETRAKYEKVVRSGR
jgi:hypothetical protein